MIRSVHEVEWHVLEDEGAAEEQWPPLTDDHIPSRQLATVPQLRHLYELLFLAVAFLGVAAGLLWHRADQRIVQLEADLIALSEEFVHLQQPIVVDSTSFNGTGAARKDASHPYIFDGEYLRFEASADTAAVAGSVVRLSELYYCQLRQELGLSMAMPDAKVTLVVGLGARSLEGDPNAIILSHPANAAEYLGITEVDVLTKEIFARLSIHLLHEVRTNRTIRAPWRPMVEGFYLYLARENGYDAEWKGQDIYLTRRHKAQQQSLDTVFVQANQFPDENGQWFTHHSPANDVVDPLIEYILVTYGNSIVPSLFDAFEEHANWETLTPALFGVTAAEFEDAWHGYLRNMYPLPIS